MRFVLVYVKIHRYFVRSNRTPRTTWLPVPIPDISSIREMGLRRAAKPLVSIYSRWV